MVKVCEILYLQMVGCLWHNNNLNRGGHLTSFCDLVVNINHPSFIDVPMEIFNTVFFIRHLDLSNIYSYNKVEYMFDF